MGPQGNIDAITTALNVGADLMQARAIKSSSDKESRQLLENADATIAQSSREAYEKGREAKIIESNARAAMAASGGTTTDAGAIEEIAKIRRDGKYNVLATLYEGRRSALGQKRTASAVREQAKYASHSSLTRALSTAVTGGHKAYQSYKASK